MTDNKATQIETFYSETEVNKFCIDHEVVDVKYIGEAGVTGIKFMVIYKKWVQ